MCLDHSGTFIDKFKCSGLCVQGVPCHRSPHNVSTCQDVFVKPFLIKKLINTFVRSKCKNQIL